jgi:hypothetical protein
MLKIKDLKADTLAIDSNDGRMRAIKLEELRKIEGGLPVPQIVGGVSGAVGGGVSAYLSQRNPNGTTNWNNVATATVVGGVTGAINPVNGIRQALGSAAVGTSAAIGGNATANVLNGNSPTGAKRW